MPEIEKSIVDKRKYSADRSTTPKSVFEADFLKEHPNAKIIANYLTPNTIEDFSYSVDLVIDEKVLEIFRDEWHKATVDHDFLERPRRALQKVIDYWQDPEPNVEVDIVSYDQGRKVIGKGQLSITDQGLEIVGKIDDPKTLADIYKDQAEDFSIYTPPPRPVPWVDYEITNEPWKHLVDGDHVTHQMSDGTQVVKIYRGRVWNPETRTYVFQFDDLPKDVTGGQ